MFKIKFLTFLFFILFFPPFLFAEEITITTYYPSPYGVYNQLQTNRLAVGYTDAADQPNRDGDIRLKAQPGDPTTTWPAGTTGQFSYSSTQDSLYHYNGSAWVASSGGTSYVDYSMPAGRSVGSACSISGFTIKGDLGSWGYCYGPGYFGGIASFFRPPGGGCPSGWGGCADVGEAYVCSQ